MNRTPANPKITRLRKIIYAYFSMHGRELPWRRGYDPYHIFISEIMLQQTQVDRVALKFDAFIKVLPNFKILAKAPLSQVLSLWQGLGYNRRALHLKRAAEIIVKDYKGVLPSSPDLLLALPGVGKATAASICAFAFNMPTLFLETNIRTVIIHHFFRNRTSVSDDELRPVTETILDKRNPRKWYSAIMDYGAMLKKQHGNASRRSVHYAKQPKFEGSNRQMRGNILKLLLESKTLSCASISRHFSGSSHRLQQVLGELEDEKMIRRKSSKYSISS